ncbi:hypothetical protein FRC17_001389 [Serendipita sp. 399]|nr:hypothetical protein FRC17_001389 [Serendipita sp. 399]
MPTEYPVEVLDAICSAVFNAAEPPPVSSLDPVIHQQCLTLPSPTTFPTSYPPGSWPEPLSRLTLTNLSRVSKAFYKATRQYVWRRVEIHLPRTWLALVEEITGGEEIVDEEAANLVEQSLNEAATYVYAATSPTMEIDRDELFRLRSIIRARLERDAIDLPPEVLTPPDSRNASPMRPRNQSLEARNSRHKSKSPGRWRVIRAVSRATRDVVASVKPQLYVPMPQDARPGRYIIHLDFNHFRTIGLRRSVGEGVNSRFVTGERLHLALKEMPNLVTFGATEYMDGALTFSVLTELLFRGRPMSNQKRQPSRGRNPSPEETESGPHDWYRRKDAQALQALDLCGCVSSVFVKALTDFVIMYLMGPEQPAEDVPERGRGVRFEDEEIYFPRLSRLCLRSVSSISSTILTPFVLAFPSLTHLDLSGTRCAPELLDGLAESHTIHLVSLSLGRCHRITSESVKNLLINGPCTFDLEHLSLFGDVTCPFPFEEEDVEAFLLEAPCIAHGRLTYLDLSSHPITALHLAACPPQPMLRSLGLSFITNLELPEVAKFLLNKASNVEIITLVSTSPQLAATAPIRQSTLAVHSTLIQQLCTLPFTLRTDPETLKRQQAATKLRVIELSPHILSALGGGAGSWRVVRSKGARGWYVDSGCGWTAERGDAGPDGVEKALFKRGLPSEHPLRKGLESLAESGGNVSTAVGWHARKMEVLQGDGLLGREDGLYGAMSFAFAG